MPYVDRNQAGQVVGAFAVEQYPGQEFVEGEVAIALPPLTPAQQIAQLERDNLLPKATRKFMLSFMETTAIQQGAAQGMTREQALAALAAGNPGYAAVKALDDQIEALEELL